MSKAKLVRSDDTYYIGDVRRQITNLKAQYLQMFWSNPMIYSEENYIKGVKSICGRVAKHFGTKFNKNTDDLKQEINDLISKIPQQESKETEETLDEVGIPEIRQMKMMMSGAIQSEEREEENSVEALDEQSGGETRQE